MNKSFISSSLFLILLSGALLFGCDRNNRLADLHRYMNNVKKSDSVTKIASLPPITPSFTQPVTYKANAIRAPFQLNIEPNNQRVAGSGPLQSFPLTALKFVGTAAEGNMVTAYILTPNNMIFQVKKGDVIGEHYGKIINILPSTITVEENKAGDKGKGSKIVELQLKDNNG